MKAIRCDFGTRHDLPDGGMGAITHTWQCTVHHPLPCGHSTEQYAQWFESMYKVALQIPAVLGSITSLVWGSAALDMAVTLARSCRSIAEAIPAYMQACGAMCPNLLMHSSQVCAGYTSSVPRWSPVGASFISGWTVGYSRAVTQDIFRASGGIFPGFAALDSAPISQGIWLTSHQTYKPNVYKRKQCHGFLKRCALGLIF